MPFIQTRTNVNISKDKELRIKEEFENSITLLGKNVNWLMLEFVGDCNMYFGGQEKEVAYVDIRLLGSASKEGYDRMTEEVTNILSSVLNILPDNIYVSYLEYDNWGWNGNNL